MKESRFIQQRHQRWQAFEKEIDRKDSDPQQLTSAYLEVLDDLSYARTHYPNRFVRNYLNGLGQELGLKFLRSGQFRLKNVWHFWSVDLPKVSYTSRKRLLFSLGVFSFFVLIGFLSVLEDQAFARSILGDQYVQMTKENIANGDPMSVYKDGNVDQMFFGITLNNTRIAATTYALGFTAGIGTLLILIFNGVMLGVFQGFFIHEGLFWESFLTIWQHGVVEISAIVLSGGAAFELASGLLFPGDLSRIDSLRAAGRRSIRLMMGILPLLVYSGLVETFVTRLTDIPDAIRLMAILFSAIAVFTYFGLYPYLKFRHEKDLHLPQQDLKPLEKHVFNSHRIEPLAHVLQHALRQLFLPKLRETLIFLAVFALAFFSQQMLQRANDESWNLYILLFNRGSLPGSHWPLLMLMQLGIGASAFLWTLFAFQKNHQIAPIRWPWAITTLLAYSMLLAIVSRHYSFQFIWLCLQPLLIPIVRYWVFPDDTVAPTARSIWAIAGIGYWRNLLSVLVVALFFFITFWLLEILVIPLADTFRMVVLPLTFLPLHIDRILLHDLLPHLTLTFYYAWMLNALFNFTFSHGLQFSSADLRAEMNSLFDEKKESRSSVSLLNSKRLGHR